jgi:predicted lipoprotein with Yx(FWY)xxD motif
VVGVRDTSLGRILVDGQGRTLYRFGKDTGARSTCAGACATNWPPVLTTGRPTAGAGASAASVASSHRPDGGRGVTYAGHPLYAFSGDGAPGDTNGEGIEAFGGRWDAVTASGAVTVASTTRGY